MAGEWMTAAEILDLGAASLPGSMSKLAEFIQRQEWSASERLCRVRFGRGGGREYHISLLPSDARAKALALLMPPTEDAEGVSNAAWAAFERLTEKAKEEARQRLIAVEAVQSYGNSVTREIAVLHVAREFKVSKTTLWNWLRMVDGVPRADRLPALAPRHVGRTATAPCDPRAWDMLVADYLRPESRGFEACYRGMLRAAKEEGWSPIPSGKTLQRRIEKEFPRSVRTLARQGREAAGRIYPHQRRDKGMFHGVQCVNADGHKYDVFVRWEDGSITRPIGVAFQDLYSGAILSHRIDKTENRELVRLAFADMIRDWGIPEQAWLDNGRGFASKWMTGRMATRFRFKVKDDEPEGLFTSLGVNVHWTTPYHGQSKPIERAWRDFGDAIEKHPRFAGAYTGNNPMAKPENYGNAAIPIAEFRRVVTAEIAAHNMREGRRSANANGRSLLATLQESLSQPHVLVRRATTAQRRLMLMAAEGVTVRKPTGEIQLEGSRYWAEELVDHMGEKVTVRFDPQDLASAIGVYTLDGRLICEAAAVGDVAFSDVEAARDHARRRKDYIRKQRDYLAAEQRMDIETVASLLPLPEAPTPEPARVTRMVAAGGRSAPVAGEWSGASDFGRGVALMGEGQVLPFRPVDSGED